jgi:hypothetical protein
MAAFTQHGDTSTMEHCEAVAYFSLAFARAMRLRLDATVPTARHIA